MVPDEFLLAGRSTKQIKTGSLNLFNRDFLHKNCFHLLFPIFYKHVKVSNMKMHIKYILTQVSHILL